MPATPPAARTTVLVLERFAADYARHLGAAFPGLAIHTAGTIPEIAAPLDRIDVLVAFGVAIDDGLMRGLTSLKWIQSLATGVDLLFHFCYGDANHKHVVEPTDMADMVDLANELTRRVSRPIQMIHMPVPRDRSDDAYFEPLRRLALPPATLLCLGLVHHTDGLDGTRRRIEAAQRYRCDFGIATECGFGRRRPETIADLIDIHAQAADL